jgi:hypothetical protein
MSPKRRCLNFFMAAELLVGSMSEDTRFFGGEKIPALAVKVCVCYAKHVFIYKARIFV